MDPSIIYLIFQIAGYSNIVVLPVVLLVLVRYLTRQNNLRTGRRTEKVSFPVWALFLFLAPVVLTFLLGRHLQSVYGRELRGRLATHLDKNLSGGLRLEKAGQPARPRPAESVDGKGGTLAPVSELPGSPVVAENKWRRALLNLKPVPFRVPVFDQREHWLRLYSGDRVEFTLVLKAPEKEKRKKAPRNNKTGGSAGPDLSGQERAENGKGQLPLETEGARNKKGAKKRFWVFWQGHPFGQTNPLGVLEIDRAALGK